MVSLKEYLTDCEKDYWESLVASVKHPRAACKIAKVSLATYYRHSRIKKEVLRKVRLKTSTALEVHRFKRYGSDVSKLFLTFGIRISHDRWRILKKRGHVRELERLYNQAHETYRRYMRRYHPDVCGTVKDVAEINAQWMLLKKHLKKALWRNGAYAS